jgi:hypothetical protein
MIYQTDKHCINVYQENGELTRWAKNVLRDEGSVGQHIGQEYSTLAIESRPTGSGANLPTNADYGVTLSVRKKGASRYCTPGEVDGLNIVVANGGEKSDAAGTLVNVANLGNGFTTAHEYVVSSYNDANTAIVRQVRGQVGVTDTANNNSFGINVSMDIGNDGTAYRCDTTTGQWWANFMRCYNDGVEKFKIDGNGVVHSKGVNVNAAPVANPLGVCYGGTWSYTATAGTVTPPSMVEGYINVNIGGTPYKIPYYRA